jgi:hypothetical protein
MIKVKCVDCGKDFYCKGDTVCKKSIMKSNAICLCRECTLKNKAEIRNCGYREIGEKVDFT